MLNSSLCQPLSKMSASGIWRKVKPFHFTAFWGKPVIGNHSKNLIILQSNKKFSMWRRISDSWIIKFSLNILKRQISAKSVVILFNQFFYFIRICGPATICIWSVSLFLKSVVIIKLSLNLLTPFYSEKAANAQSLKLFLYTFQKMERWKPNLVHIFRYWIGTVWDGYGKKYSGILWLWTQKMLLCGVSA